LRAHEMLALEEADGGLDGSASFHVALGVRRGAAYLARIRTLNVPDIIADRLSTWMRRGSTQVVRSR